MDNDDNNISIDLSNIDITSSIDSGSSGTIVLDFNDSYAVGASVDYTYTTISNISLTDTITLSSDLSSWVDEQNILEEHRIAERVRKNHPAVQAAWEQYQIMLNLAREESDEIDPNEDLQ